MASQGVAPQQNHVDDEHEAPHADAEVPVEPKTSPRVGSEDDEEGQSDVKEITMKILQGQREGVLAAEALARLTHRAGGRVRPEGFVIGAAVVIAGQAKTTGRPKDQNRRRKGEPAWEP